VSIARQLLAHVAGRRDIALAVALCAAGEYELFAPVTYEGAPVWPGDRMVTAVVIPLLTLPLAARRRWPTAVCLSVFAGLALSAALLGGGEATTGFVLFIATTFTAAAHARWPAWCAAAALAAGAVHEVRDSHVHGFSDVVWAFGMLVIAWLLGTAVRVRQHRIGVLEEAAIEAEQRHAEQVAAATTAERAAIARELHDIVAHAVSVIVIQAQAGSRALPDNVELADQVLQQIEVSGRTALSELRGLLTLLADDTCAADVHPAASLSQLDDLIQRCRAAGQRIEFHLDGALPGLAPVADLAAYRVIQEALTNTMRHAPGAVTHLRLHRQGNLLQIHAEDDGGCRTPAPNRAGNGSGRGLIGMRERLALAGGRLVRAEPTETGFRVHAEVPIEADAHAPLREPVA
jgi:signal transduction histidine kinase